MRFLHVAGNIEIARLPHQNSLKNVFERVAGLVDRTNEQLMSLQAAVGRMRNAVTSSAKPRKIAARAVQEVTRLSSCLS